MIGKIFRFEDYDKTFVYFKIIEIYDDRSYRCICIKSAIKNYKIGKEYIMYKAWITKEISEYDFNKIMVFS